MQIRKPCLIHPENQTNYVNEHKSGPVFVLQGDDGYVDTINGFVFTADRQLIIETAAVARLAEQGIRIAKDNGFVLDQDWNVPRLSNNEVAIVISGQRSSNYCRWWLDIISRFYIYDLLIGTLVEKGLKPVYILPKADLPFQTQSLSLFGFDRMVTSGIDPMIRGSYWVTSGLTFGGGQCISSRLVGFRDYLLSRADYIAARKVAEARVVSTKRIFVSRSKTRMRRILNESDLWGDLEKRGFNVVYLEELSLIDQIIIFSNAEVIVGAHGAGFTNLMFSAQGAKFLEIFPDCGFHSSAFCRMASILGLDYYPYIGTGIVMTSGDQKNPNNADIIIDSRVFLRFLDKVISE